MTDMIAIVPQMSEHQKLPKREKSENEDQAIKSEVMHFVKRSVYYEPLYTRRG